MAAIVGLPRSSLSESDGSFAAACTLRVCSAVGSTRRSFSHGEVVPPLASLWCHRRRHYS